MLVENLKYLIDYINFRTLYKKNPRGFSFLWKNRKPKLFDNTKTTHFDRHYIYHPAWAARVLAKTKPKKHVDISSTLVFSTLISAFIPVDFYDFRPANIQLSDYKVKKADLTALSLKNNSIMSLSCMHTIEHIGLGRYGDKIDPDGDLKAVRELIRVLAVGGDLLIVVPIGKQKLAFNAHRIYSFRQIIKYFSPLKLREFSLIPDSGAIIYRATEKIADTQKYGCGCFWFKKE